MKYSCVVSLVAAALALVVVPGCASGGSNGGGGGGGGGGGNKEKQLPTITPPGLAPGLIQISKGTGAGETVIGYVGVDNDSEAWVLSNGVAYPLVMLANEYIKFQWVAPIGAVDVQPTDGNVTSTEVCLSAWGATLQKPASKHTVVQSETMDGPCW